MNPIEEIQRRLEKYPQARYEITEDNITVLAADANGFNVSLTDEAPGYTVHFDRWHEEYEDADAALNAFAFGLSEDCRLEVTYRGDTAYFWRVEERSPDGTWSSCEWIGSSEIGFLAPQPFSKKKHKRYLQNHAIKSARGD